MVPTPLPFAWLKRDEVLTDEYDVLSHAALAYSGDMMIELIRPGSDPSPYRDFLDAGRRGVHHLGTVATDYDAQMAAARAAGIHVAVEGELHISRFPYLATDAPFPGTMLELIGMSQKSKDPVAMVREDRKSVVWVKTGSVRIDVGGRRNSKKKRTKQEG